jgi:hypothetical protein
VPVQQHDLGVLLYKTMQKLYRRSRPCNKHGRFYKEYLGYSLLLFGCPARLPQVRHLYFITTQVNE